MNEDETRSDYVKELFKELIEYRHLLFTLTWKEIKVRYKQTVMGFMWAIFMPMFIVGAGLLVKKAFSVVSGKPLVLSDLASVSVKAIPWSFFIGAIKLSTNSLLGNRNLVTKIYFPREVFPIAAVLANLFDFLVASVALIIFLAFAGITISVQLIWLPAIISCLVILTIALGMMLSCANLFFRDVKYIVDVVLTFAIFFTPVFYEASMFGKWKFVLLMNPVAAILEDINSVVVYQNPPDLFWFAYSIGWAVGGLIIAWNTFHKLEFAFAENI